MKCLLGSHCSFCGREFFIGKKDRTLINVPNSVLCSAKCLLLYLMKREWEVRELHVLVPLRENKAQFKLSSHVSEEMDAFSSALFQCFRSRLEVHTAEFLTAHSVAWWYEKVSIQLGNRWYTPDFYIPSARAFLEVKGFWGFGSKKKFRQAVREVPEEIILVPSYMEVGLGKRYEVHEEDGSCRRTGAAAS